MALELVQLAAVVVVLVGVALTLPLGPALIVNGALVLGAAVVTERQLN